MGYGLGYAEGMTKNIEFPSLESALDEYYKDDTEYYPDEPRVGVIESKCCPVCVTSVFFLVPVSAVNAYTLGRVVQDAFPMLNRDQRERLVTGYCATCWDNLFANLEPNTDSE